MDIERLIDIFSDKMMEGTLILFDEKLKELGYDITRRGKVISVNTHIAIVQIDGEEYTCKLKRGINVKPNDIVYVKYPQNNDHDKYIDSILGINEAAEVIEITAEEILSKLKTVDGVGSGLDADFLQGKPASSFATLDDIGDINVDISGETIVNNINSTNSIIDDKNLSTNVNDAISKKHTHSNQALLDDVTQEKLDTWDTVTNKVDNSRVLTDVPVNAKFTDTTYSEITTAEIDNESTSTLRAITGRRIGYLLNKVRSMISALTKADFDLNKVENKSSSDIRNEITSSNVTNALGYIPLNSTLKGSSNGLAELDSGGKVPSSQLPSYVDDVLEYSTKINFPASGETGKIYVAIDTNLTYRWSGIGYVEISPSIALGETSSTAYRGDRGKIAYDHSQVPHDKNLVGLNKVDNKSSEDIRNEITKLNIENGLGYTPLKDIPIASNARLGGIKVGANLFIDEDGTLSALSGDERSSFIIKQEIFVATEGQTIFNLTKGHYQPNTNTISVYIYGGKQPNVALNEISSSSFALTEPLKAGDVVIVEYFELSSAAPYPLHGNDHLTGDYDPIPKATTNSDGLMAKEDKSKLSNLHKVATSGDYADLNSKPFIPTLVSQLTNDSNYETTTGSQTKANQAENNAKAYTDNRLTSFEGMKAHGDEWHNENYAKQSDIPDVSGKADKTYVDTQLGNKADKSHVHSYVPLDGDSTITGTKTFSDTLKLSGIENFNDVYIKRTLGRGTVGTTYANLSDEIRNGGYHRFWKISFQSGVSFWGKIKISLYGGYSSFNASGKMAKEINVNFNGASMYSNVGCYTELSGYVENDFRISEAVWNPNTSQWEFWIYSHRLNGNNTPYIVLEAWASGISYINAFNGITFNTTPEFLTDLSYNNVKGNTAGQTIVKLWGGLPTYQNPYGMTIATHDDVYTKSETDTHLSNKVDNSRVLTDVPANAKFTDTVYTHPTSDGNLHVPTTGTSNNGKVLKAGATAGSLVWGIDNDTITTINGKTGAITKADIVALGIPAQDTNTTYTAGAGLILTGTVFTPDFGTGVGKVVQGNDSRLSDARTPLAHNHTKSQITDFPTLSTVATSGNYDDLSNKPTIPTDTNQLAKTDVYTKTEVNNLLSSAGQGDMMRSQYDTNNNGKVDVAEVAESIDWENVSGKKVFPVSTASESSLTIPHGVAPTSPVNGDMWTTTSGLYLRLNGTTRTMAHTASWSTVSQVEAETGTATTQRLWTAQRVRQAIEAVPTVHVGVNPPTILNVGWVDTSL